MIILKIQILWKRRGAGFGVGEACFIEGFGIGNELRHMRVVSAFQFRNYGNISGGRSKKRDLRGRGMVWVHKCAYWMG